MFPKATKLRPPQGGWPSHRAEYEIEGQPNRFRYVVDEQYSTKEPPPKSTSGKLRLFAMVGKGVGAAALFEEIPNRPPAAAKMIGKALWLVIGRTITGSGEDRGKIYTFLLTNKPTEKEAMSLCIEAAIEAEGPDHTDLYWDNLDVRQLTVGK